MYYVVGVVCLCYLILAILSRREGVPRGESAVLRPFCRMALYLYKRACIHRLPFFSTKQVREDLARLYPREGRESVCTDYYVRKLALSLLIVLVGSVLGLAVSAQAQSKRALSDEGTVTRSSYEDGERTLRVECTVESGKKQFQVQVAPRALSAEEISGQYALFCQELPRLIRGDNPSLEEVSEDLQLSETYDGYPFAITWKSGDPEILRDDGRVSPPEEGERTVRLSAVIACGEREWREELSVKVVPVVYSQEEMDRRELEKILLASEAESREEAQWQLPQDWRGNKLVWRERTKDRGMLLGLGAVAVSVTIYLLADRDLHDRLEKRKRKMRREYPDVVHKLALYLGAGMTIRNAFQRMAGDYERSRREGGSECPIYEELLYLNRELQAGVSEGAAYEHFGRRTGLQEYIRLCTLLTQNLKKGSTALLERLGEEAEKAYEERMRDGKRLAEEAVTKLLLPMVMMLLVVMLIIMIPAFSSMGA